MMYPSGVRTIGVQAIFLDELEQQEEKAKVSSRGVYPLIGGCVADSVGDRRTRSRELEPFSHPRRKGESSRPCLSLAICASYVPLRLIRGSAALFFADGSKY